MATKKNVKRLSKRTIDATSIPMGGKARLWDSELKGFGICIYPSGRKVYFIGYRDPQQRYHWYTIGKHGDPWTPEIARNKARELFGRIAQNDFPHIEKQKARKDSLTVAELVAKYLEEGPLDKPEKRESSWKNDRSNLCNHVVPHLGTLLVKDLDRDTISRFQQDVANCKSPRRKPKRGPTTRGGRGAATHAVRSMSAMFGWAIRIGILENNPCQHVRRLSDGRRDRFLDQCEARRLFEALDSLEETGKINPSHADCLKILAYTAARKGEIIGLRWSEVDPENRRLILPPLRHKTGGSFKPKTIPLSRNCIQILERCRERAGNSPFVFPLEHDGTKHIKTLAYTWEKVTEAAELVDFRIHDLRHAYASFAINAGFSLKTIGENLGHVRASTTERYAHLLLETRRPVADAVEQAYGITKQSNAG